MNYMRSSTRSLIKEQSARSHLIPVDFLVEDLKAKRKFRFLSRKLGSFVTFVAIYVAVLLMDRNIYGRSVARHIVSNALVDTSRAASGITFANINDAGTFWDWLINSFMVVMYDQYDSDGIPKNWDELFTIAAHTRIVGGFHLTQTRFDEVNTTDPANSNDPCFNATYHEFDMACYSNRKESNVSFGYVNYTDEGAAELATLDMFKYSNNATIGIGFQTYFLRSYTGGLAEFKKASLMRAHRWIDRQTKQVSLTMPMYNNNLKIWSIVHLTVDFDLAGGVTPQCKIHVTNIEPYDFKNKKNIIRSILEGIFLGHVIYFFLLELWDICVLSGGSWKVYMARYGFVNNMSDWANILVNFAIVLWRYFMQHNEVRKQMLELESFDKYIDALSLAQWDEVLLAMNIFNMLLLTARTLKYFQVTNGGRRLMHSVYGAMPEIMSFLPIYFAVIMGYTFAGHMLYGLQYPEWSTFFGSLFRVFELNFGLYDPGPIYDSGGYLSATFIYTSNIVFCILMLNVFMAIVMSTWDQLKEEEANKVKDRLRYSKKLSYSDMIHLVMLNEDVVDSLIDVAMDFEEAEEELVTREQFVKAFHELGIDIKPASWERVLEWYWVREESGNSIGKVKPALENDASTKDVMVIKSPRDLDAQLPLAKKEKKPKRASAKVAIDTDTTTIPPIRLKATKTKDEAALKPEADSSPPAAAVPSNTDPPIPSAVAATGSALTNNAATESPLQPAVSEVKVEQDVPQPPAEPPLPADEHVQIHPM
ncbi:TPA: hypothetical protein N0F65_010379 [Lagenidium giganteum]|uniref:Polycystin cation channel PKD1/PKD2 domain-containing protein n=1 Tax=Lagenidium giganteum TaxID=4803 RepID=A0AAV2YJL0_9STRA|nr:TPA: hypothetical protein N0F65_010379 [Lagenidium giganteum]